MIRKVCASISVIVLILQSGLIYAGTLDLNALLSEAREKNPEILAAKKRYEASQARVPQAKSLDNPTIGLGFEKIPKGTLKLNRVEPNDRMLSITQMFPFFGKLPLKGKIALVESQISAAEYKDKELEIINGVKSAYYDLFMNYKETELNQQGLVLLENIAKTAETKYSVSQITQEEVFKIFLEIARLRNAITNLKQENLAKQTRLNSLLNRDPEAPLGNPVVDEEMSFNKDIQSLYKLTLESNLELHIFSYAIERNRHAKQLAKKSFLPDIMGGIVLRGITSGGIGPWDLMLSLSVPFWFWTKQRYEVKEAIANLEEAEAAYQAMKNKALAETKELYTKIEIAKSKADLYNNTQIPIIESSIASSLSAFRAGEGDIMLLLDSLRMLIEAKMSYYKALVEYNMNLADLERAVGTELREVEK